MATKPELYKKVAQKLRLLEGEETLKASDEAIIEQVYLETLEEMLTLGLADWTDADAIPEDAVSSMKTIIAANAADEFSIPEPILLRLQGQKQGALIQLRRTLDRAFSSRTTEAEYF